MNLYPKAPKGACPSKIYAAKNAPQQKCEDGKSGNTAKIPLSKRRQPPASPKGGNALPKHMYAREGVGAVPQQTLHKQTHRFRKSAPDWCTPGTISRPRSGALPKQQVLQTAPPGSDSAHYSSQYCGYVAAAAIGPGPGHCRLPGGAACLTGGGELSAAARLSAARRGSGLLTSRRT